MQDIAHVRIRQIEIANNRRVAVEAALPEAQSGVVDRHAPGLRSSRADRSKWFFRLFLVIGSKVGANGILSLSPKVILIKGLGYYPAQFRIALHQYAARFHQVLETVTCR